MELGFTLVLIVLSLVVGAVIGVIIGRSTRRKDTCGELFVMPGAPEGQGLFLDQHVPTSTIASKKRVSFSVYVVRDNSRE